MPRHIKRAFDRGIAWRGAVFSVKAFKTGKDFNARLAVVISKKTTAKATTRNLIRRRVKAAFSSRLEDLRGWDVVVTPRPGAEEKKFEDILGDVSACADTLRSS